jgi:hypothetical protein
MRQARPPTPVEDEVEEEVVAGDGNEDEEE